MMSCHFETLFFSDDGYVVRCKQCGYYQIAFLCMSISLNEADFKTFCKIAKTQLEQCQSSFSEQSKCIMINTPAEHVSLLLTRNEAKLLHSMLDEADNESKALSLINLFNQ